MTNPMRKGSPCRTVPGMSMLASRPVILICLASSKVSCFSSSTLYPPLASKRTTVQPTKLTTERTLSASALQAMIFYPDDDDGPSLDEDAGVTYDLDLQRQHEELAIKLSSNQSQLARLASVYAPTGHDIDVTRINSVRCASLDNRHLEIEAILCDDLECNALLVPVDFPIECSVSDPPFFEECVMNHLYSLDQQGEKRLFRQEEFVNHDAELAYETLQSAQELLRDVSLVFPEWWVSSPETEMSEGELLTELLNGNGMLDRIMDMVVQNQKSLLDDEANEFDVLAIGPIG